MNNKLCALKAERELVQAAYSTKYNNLIKDLDRIINKYFLEPFNATCIRRWIREEFYPERGVCINFELGFHNVTEDRIDFGSDMCFTYDAVKKSLEVNYGTCGAYSKQDEYQVKRVKTIAYIWDNIDEVEAALDNYSVEITPTILNNYDKLYDIDKEICSIEHEIQTQKKDAISASLQIGKVVFYNEDCVLCASQKHFVGACKIVKVTPKFVTLLDTYDREMRVKKALIVSHAFENYITIK